MCGCVCGMGECMCGWVNVVGEYVWWVSVCVMGEYVWVGSKCGWVSVYVVGEWVGG